jgi:hypothetical protein
MVRDGIKAAQIQAQYSTLNGPWAAGPFQSINVVSAIKHAAARLNPHFGVGQRHTGRHVAPGRTFLSRNTAR